MEGPTPVSALIHAATMVTAGVYMIGRNAVLFEHAPITLGIVAAIGAATALFAGTIGLVQNDIKRVLAYSTVSQLGYMFLAMGVGAFGAGIFHLYTHAFFKACLFLGSGAVIHALHGEQDIRHMGGLKQHLPITYWTFLVASLAIAGVPLLAGFFSKDEILFETFRHGHTWLWVIGALTSLLTATYMFRLVFLTFHGERRARRRRRPPLTATGIDGHSPSPRGSGVHAAPAHAAHDTAGGHGGHLHDAPAPMALALIVLAIGSVLAGYVGVPHALGGHNALGEWLHPSFTATPKALAECNVPVVLPGAPAGMTLAECAPGDAVPAMASSAATAAERAVAGVARLARAGAGRGRRRAGGGRRGPRRDGARTDADGRVVAHRPARHRPGRLPVAEEPADSRLAGGAVPRPAPAAAQQVLRRRDLRRRDRPSDPAGLDRRAVEGDRRQGRGRRGQPRRVPGGRRERGAAADADRLGAQLRGLDVRRRRARARLLPLEIVTVTGLPILTLLVALPLAGALLLLACPTATAPRTTPSAWTALGVSLLTFLLSLALWAGFDASAAAPAFQAVERHAWIPTFGIDYYVGIDGISLMLLVLTTFLTPIALLSSWEGIHERVKAFSIFMLLLEAAMIGVFISLDLFLFYVFWDFMLIPMYFLIGIWGYDQRIYASIKFLLYTMAGSVLMLVAIIGIAWLHQQATGQYSFDLLKLYELRVPETLQYWFFLAFAVAFAIKVPLFPFHTWLPDAHVQAPTRRLGDPGRRPAEDGRLRPHPLRLPALPGSGAGLRAAAGHAGGHRHRLRRAGRDGAARHEEAGRLLVGEPHGLRRARHRGDERPGRAGRHLPDARPRRQHRRPLRASSACCPTAATPG